MAETKATGRPPSKGRQRIVIAPIANKDRRQVTCSKRKAGFFKKASEIALLCGARVAAILFSGSGKVYAFGSPSVDGVLRGLADGGAPYLDDEETERAAVEATLRKEEETKALVAKEQARMAAVGDKVLRAVAPGTGRRRFWWEADVQQLGEAEVLDFTRALLRLRDNVQRHADKLRAETSSNPAAGAVMPDCRLKAESFC